MATRSPKGGRISGGGFPAARVFSWGALALGVLTGAALFNSPQNVTHVSAAAGSAPVIGGTQINNHFPEIKLPEPNVYVAADTPYTRRVVGQETAARQRMVAAAQAELNSEFSRSTTRVVGGRTVTTLETPPIYYSDCEDNEKLGTYDSEGRYIEGAPFPRGGRSRTTLVRRAAVVEPGLF